MSYKERILNLKHYIFNLIIIWLAILFYRYSSFYSNFLSQKTQTTILALAVIYTISGFFYYLLKSPEKIIESKGTILFRALKRSIKEVFNLLRIFNTNTNKKFPKFDKKEKTAFLFLVVKIFFLPLMLNFLFGNFSSAKNNLTNISEISQFTNIYTFNDLIFPFIISAIFFLDTLWFSFGYAFESRSLKNTIRSVEPTILGWAAALICYPPFNGMLTKYTNWYANDHILFFNNTLTFAIRIIIVALLLIYLSATFALGAKCSNLTNRGIVARGPYKFIRHPAYISKNLAWWLTIIPVASLPAIISMGTWSIIYHIRAITEERHLIKDPNYQSYCRQVKYKYIPFVY